MAYGFNDDKSKAEVYTKTEQAAMIKVVSVSGQVYDNGVNGQCYINGTAFTVPTGYTPIGVVLVPSYADMLCSLQNVSNIWKVNAMIKSSGAAKVATFTAKVYCIKNVYITT